MLIAGIDCATNPKKIGLARGQVVGDRCSLVSVHREGSLDLIVDRVVSWISDSSSCLIAIDAPLGWPHHLGRALVAHAAGDEVSVDANLLFRRETDRSIKARIGKQPLDVGADRIARTAHAALYLIGRLRAATGLEIPLAWALQNPGTAAIEVYPAATLVAHGLRASRYKKSEQRVERKEIIRGLTDRLEVSEGIDEMEANDDVLDAAVCVLAGFDFLQGEAMPPADLELAQSEGWIWVRDKPS